MGNKDNYPRLVGGTFVTILEQYRRYKRPNREKIRKPDFVIGFFKALGIPELECEEIVGSQISYFTRCNTWTFKDSFLEQTNLSSMESSISSLWRGVDEFFDEFMIDGSRMKVVAALKEMIEEDDSIKDTDWFVLDENGRTIRKHEIHTMTSIPFIPFVTGVALFALKRNNKDGKATIDVWCNNEEKAPAKTDIGHKNWGKISDDGIPENNLVSSITNNLSLFDDGELSNVKTVSNADSSVSVNAGAHSTAQIDSSEESFYDIDERDYLALWKQANNQDRDQRNLNMLMREIKRKINLYVKTNLYRETYNKILDLGYVLLTGNPGTGKSMTSELVALRFAGTGKYIIHYLRGVDEDDVKILYDEITSEKANDEYHFILIDDCMGQAFYQLSEKKEDYFYKLVSYVEMRPHRLKMLLNSRISIVEGAKKHKIYEEIFEEMEKTGRIINANSLSKKEKALILRSHIFDRSDEEHYNDIKGDRVLKIVNHNPYIPRVIYHVTDRKRPIKKSGDFFIEIMKALDNPEEIWDDIYDDGNITPPEAKILLKALYSLTNTSVETDICFKVFKEYLKTSGVKTEPRKAFKVAIQVLNSSMIFREIGEKDMIGFVDPSVHDFLSNSVYYKDSTEYKSLFEHVIHKKQVDKLYEMERYSIIREFVQNGQILNIEYPNEYEKCLEIFDSIAHWRICRESYKVIFDNCIGYLNSLPEFRKFWDTFRGYRFYQMGLQMLLALMEHDEFREFYCGERISYNIYEACIKKVDYYHLTIFFNGYYRLDEPCFDFEMNETEVSKLISNCCKNTSLELDSYLFDLTDSYDSRELDYYNDKVNKAISEDLHREIRELDSCVPDYVRNEMRKGIYMLGFCQDYTEDIANYYENEDDSEEEESKETIVDDDDENSDIAVMALFETPYRKK